MKNHWTFGQYTLYRFLFGLYLCFHFLQLLPWVSELFSNEGMVPDYHLSPLMHLFPNVLRVNDSPLFILTLDICALFASICFMIGKWDRISAAFLWYILACFIGRNPFISNPSLPFIGWLLLAHLFLPRKKIDSVKDWKMPPALFLVAWCVMSIAYTYSGILKLSSPSWVNGKAFFYVLNNPLARCNELREILLHLPELFLRMMSWSALALEISFVFLALFKKLRPWLWCAMLLMHLGLLFLIDFADLTLGMVILHVFTFDPGWIRPRNVEGKLVVFYDGTCGFCHSFVRFILSENSHGTAIQFAPLQNHFPKSSQNSVIVKEGETLLFKSKAVFAVLTSLGGSWKVIAWIFSCFPSQLCDCVYEGIAKIRHRFFPKPKELCPLVPSEMRKHFMD